jgi:hypothetical protein
MQECMSYVSGMRSWHLSIWLAPLIIGLILWLLSAVVHRNAKLRGIYEAHFPETPRERLFLASVAFFVTIAVVRTLTFLIHNEIGPLHNIYLRGRHIHHLVWGILLLLIVGYCWLIEAGTGGAESRTWAGRLLSMLYGVGAALTLDEFALWLNLQDVYWAREGRASIEAIFLFGGLLSIGIYGAAFFRAITRETLRLFRH